MPKGDCFEAAYKKLRELFADGDVNARLCHGFVTNPRLKRTFAHAWVENCDFIFDFSNHMDAIMPREKFYKLVSPTGVVEYEHDEAVFAFIRSRHFGPWHESFDHVG
jgi:hypothetical protein